MDERHQVGRLVRPEGRNLPVLGDISSRSLIIARPCFSVHILMGDPPPILLYCSWIFGVLLLAIHGPRNLNKAKSRAYSSNRPRRVSKLLLRGQRNEILVGEEPKQEVMYVVGRLRSAKVQHHDTSLGFPASTNPVTRLQGQRSLVVTMVTYFEFCVVASEVAFLTISRETCAFLATKALPEKNRFRLQRWPFRKVRQ